MDFHSLARKELQALCKKNKIPANITNVAMADALAALETVEGLEELLNGSQSVPGTPAMSRSVTRRKPIKEEPETAQPTTRTRGRTRRAIDQDLVETPAMPASRRQAPAASPAVQTGRYSTRRSVRLLEKSLAEISLKEPVKMDDVLDQTEEKDVAGNLEKTNDSSSGEAVESERELKDEVRKKEEMVTQDSIHLDNVSGLDAKDEVLESERELKDEVLEKDNMVAQDSSHLDNVSGLDDEVLESKRELKDEVQEKDTMVVQDSSHLDNVSGLDAKDDDSSGKTSDELDKTGPVDAPVAEFTSESGNLIAHVYDEISTKDHKADESGDDDCVLVSESPSETENASAEVMETENVPDEFSNKVAAAEVHVEEEDLELPFDSDGWETDSDESVKSNAVNVVSIDANVDNNDLDFQKSSVDDENAEVVHVEKESFLFDNVQAPNGSENLQVEMEKSAASEGLIDVNLTEGEVVISYDNNSPKFAKQTSHEATRNTPSLTLETDLISEGDKAVESKKDMIDDVDIMPSQEYDFAANLPPLPDTPPSSGEKMSPCHPVSVSKIPQMSLLGADTIAATQFPPLPSQEYDFAANLPPLPDTPPSGEKMSPCLPVSVSKIPQMSLSGADTIATQFPRPTQSTPVRSSSKKQTTDKKVTLLTDNNKENIDNSGMEVEPKKDNMKKKKNIIDVDSLNEKSLRELTKMFKEKVKIHNKKNNIDEEQFPTKQQAQVGKTRPALQTLAENVMLPEK